MEKLSLQAAIDALARVGELSWPTGGVLLALGATLLWFVGFLGLRLLGLRPAFRDLASRAFLPSLVAWFGIIGFPLSLVLRIAPAEAAGTLPARSVERRGLVRDGERDPPLVSDRARSFEAFPPYRGPHRSLPRASGDGAAFFPRGVSRRGSSREVPRRSDTRGGAALRLDECLGRAPGSRAAIASRVLRGASYRLRPLRRIRLHVSRPRRDRVPEARRRAVLVVHRSRIPRVVLEAIPRGFRLARGSGAPGGESRRTRSSRTTRWSSREWTGTRSRTPCVVR